MSGPPRWGVSALDWRSHAIDGDAEHPDGVYVARCGRRLVMGAGLYDEPPPGGWVCRACARRTERDTGEVTGPPPRSPGDRAAPPVHPVTGLAWWVRSPLDYHAHWLLSEGEHPEGVLQARCGAVMTTSATPRERPLWGLRCARCHLVFLVDAAARDG
ncbi:MAG: hypothetical protein JO063_00750 [Pseudonocardiales bacterium]|nr:hypothetical protein [Pseudonocardiales bacterium]MBV9030471.1 hypothetical protein [Pseudonocardiales bacterium]MBW0008640.1 hypothetical protein [Pseudonocardiales bacterium]